MMQITYKHIAELNSMSSRQKRMQFFSKNAQITRNIVKKFRSKFIRLNEKFVLVLTFLFLFCCFFAKKKLFNSHVIDDKITTKFTNENYKNQNELFPMQMEDFFFFCLWKSNGSLNVKSLNVNKQFDFERTFSLLSFFLFLLIRLS